MTDESSVRTPKALPDGVSQATVGVTPARYIASARRTGNCNGYQFLLGHCVWRSATGLAGHRGPPADPHGPPAC